MEMKDTTPRVKNNLTRGGDAESRSLPDTTEAVKDTSETKGSANETADDDMMISRRSVLMSGGAVAGILAGWGLGFTGSVQAQPVESFSYGGTPVMQQSAQTVTIDESESNNRRANAMEIDLGTSITAALTSNESDWYAVDLSLRDEPVVTFDRKAESGISALIFFDPNGGLNNLRYIPDDQPLTFRPAVDASGMHYFQIVDIQNSASDYRLTIETESNTESSPPTPTPTETLVTDDYGGQAYGEYGFGGVPAQ